MHIQQVIGGSRCEQEVMVGGGDMEVVVEGARRDCLWLDQFAG